MMKYLVIGNEMLVEVVLLMVELFDDDEVDEQV
jgi:hypothetical protein